MGAELLAKVRDTWLHPPFLSSPWLTVVYQASLGLVLMIMLLVGVILFLRLNLVVQERRRRRFMALWRPLMMQSLLEVPTELPRLARRDWLTFASLWNHVHESLRGDAHVRMNDLGRQVGLDRIAMGWLKRPGVRWHILAVLTLGNLRERSVWETLSRMASGPNSALSLAAVRALVQIDPQAALPVLLPAIATRKDWSAAKVAGILQESGLDNVCEPLAAAALSAPPDQANRLLRYMEALHCPSALAVVDALLADAQDEQLIASCLRMVSDPAALPLVRRYANHSRWWVRGQAASALARIGRREDETQLVGMLHDEQWWVRYRAAQALAALPFVGAEKLVAIRDAETHPLAKEVLSHVIAEAKETL